MQTGTSSLENMSNDSPKLPQDCDHLHLTFWSEEDGGMMYECDECKATFDCQWV